MSHNWILCCTTYNCISRHTTRDSRYILSSYELYLQLRNKQARPISAAFQSNWKTRSSTIGRNQLMLITWQLTGEIIATRLFGCDENKTRLPAYGVFEYCECCAIRGSSYLVYLHFFCIKFMSLLGCTIV